MHRLSSAFENNSYDGLIEESDEWALYYTFDNPNEYYILNKYRARTCLDAWLTIYGPCTGKTRPVGFVKWGDSELKPWSIKISQGADYGLLNAIHPDGTVKHLMEARGSCSTGEYRFAAWTGECFQRFSTPPCGPAGDLREKAESEVYFDFQWRL